MRETVTIKESGMEFGPFPKDSVWHIEESAIYRSITEDVKMAEFVVAITRKNKAVAHIIEAKSSSPQCSDKQDRELEKIRAKFSNALMLTLAASLGRFEQERLGLPTALLNFNIREGNFKFLLVVRNHKDDWLAPLAEKLKKALRSLIKTWNLPDASVLVLNERLAKQVKLILTEPNQV